MARARGSVWLFITPISAVAVVLLGVVSGGVRPFRTARVYSGPTQGINDLYLRVELGDRDRVVELPAKGIPFEVVAWAQGHRVASVRGRSDELGNAEVLLQLPKPLDSAFELAVEPVGAEQSPLARGLVLGSASAFRAGARGRGGFMRGNAKGTDPLTIAVAPTRGVLVTAQGALDDELLIHVDEYDVDAIGARVTAKLEGATPAVTQLTTDGNGDARLRLRASDAQLRVQLHAVSAKGGSEGSLAARLEVVQGAIRATKRDNRLLLESSGAADAAYVAFFDEKQRHGGVRVPLAAAPDGHLVGEIPWPPGLTMSPLWAVSSSQPDLASPSAVGWSVVGGDRDAQRTFDVREQLLLDGGPAARVREERRAKRVRLVTAAYATLALMITLVLFVRRVRQADVSFESHLTRAGVDEIPSIAPRRKGRAVLAAACIGLGFVVLTVFALLKD